MDGRLPSLSPRPVENSTNHTSMSSADELLLLEIEFWIVLDFQSGGVVVILCYGYSGSFAAGF